MICLRTEALEAPAFVKGIPAALRVYLDRENPPRVTGLTFPVCLDWDSGSDIDAGWGSESCPLSPGKPLHIT